MINLTIRDHSDWTQQWIKCNCLPVVPVQVIWLIAGHENFYVSTSSPKRDRAAGEGSCVCHVKTHQLICNMTYLGQSSSEVIWPDLKSSFQINLLGSKYICFDATRLEEYDGVSRFFLYLISKVICRHVDLNRKAFFVWPVRGRSKCDLR